MPKTRLISPGIANHSLKKNLILNDNYLSNDGGDEGIRITDAGNVGVNTTAVAPISKFEVFNSNVQLDGGTTGYQAINAFISSANDLTALMIGGRIIFDDGTDAGIITGYIGVNVVNVSTNQTVGSIGDQRAFKIYYPSVQIDAGASSTSLKIGNTSFDTSSGDISLASGGGGNIMMTDGTSNIFDFDVAEPSLIIYDDADTDGNRDYFKVAVGANGATYFSTNDDDGESAQIVFQPDGFLRFQAAANNSCQITHDNYTASGVQDHIVQMYDTLALTSGAGGNDTHFGVWYKQTYSGADGADGWDNIYLMYLEKIHPAQSPSQDLFAVDTNALLSITTNGTAKSVTDVVTITNTIHAADMDGTGSAIKFNQWYHDGSSPAIEDAAKIQIATETDWTATASTRDSYMAFYTSLNGTLAEKARITSAGNIGIGVADPASPLEIFNTASQLKISYDASNYADVSVGSDGQLELATTGGSSSDITLDAAGNVNIEAGRYVRLRKTGDDTSKLSFDMNTNPILEITSDADVGDTFTLQVNAAGATTIATNDDDGVAAHLTLDVDGHVGFDGCAAGFIQVEPSWGDAGVIGGGGSSTDIDFRTSNKQHLTLAGNHIDGQELQMIFPTVSGNFLLFLLQDGTGDRTVSSDAWRAYSNDESTNSAVIWAGGTAPTLTTTADKADIVSIYWDADNDKAYGVISQNF